MTFVSYAQNFEDVLLWRALRSVENGFYIDVGAAHPDIDSVTRAFYDRGWSGINVEPTAEFGLRLMAARPRDINLRIVLGEHPGRTELFAVDGTGLSTVDPAAIDPIRRVGLDGRRTEVAVDTLANLCRNHAPADIHFLKVDVEGAELSVLTGGDFTSFRPWIVLVEATAPMSTVTTHDAWEYILLTAGYHFVWFDGLNRFYIAEERHDALAHAFLTPVNVFDDFLRAADSEWARRIQEAENRAALGAAHARVLAHDLRCEIQAESARRVAAEAEAAGQAVHAAAEAQRALYESQRSAINEQLRQEATAAFDAILRSTSWRITAPLRRLKSPGGAPSPAPTPLTVQPATPAAPVAPTAAVGTGARLANRPHRPSPPHTTIHQYHSGAATGDAITNSMLLMRQRLRDLGYQSEIFVSFRGDELADELRLVDELPRHEHYILIVRHSMGFDAFDKVSSIPAPKILLYHNITPPEWMGFDDFMRRHAVLGREQLKQWRPLIKTALADSEYNAIELRRMGFDLVQVCNSLFDLDSLLDRAAATPRHKDPHCFTILFVGRIVRSKGQTELLDVFAAFRNRYRRPCRLVLVGRHGGPEDVYLSLVLERLKEYGIASDVTLTGVVSDDALHGYYASADVYLSLSRHEGFGVPLIEAMTHDLPVLALPAAAVPYTLSGTGALLEDSSIDGIVGRLLDLAGSGEKPAAVLARQRAALERVHWDRHKPAFLQALAAAGAAPPTDTTTRDVLASAMQMTVMGHVNGTYSLAVINRRLATTLESALPGHIRLTPVEGGPTGDLSGVPADELPEIEPLVSRAKPITAPVVVISQHYPVHVSTEPNDLALAYFFWEESVIPPETIATLNDNFDGVLAPSRFVAKTLIDSGLSIPVRLVGFAPRLDAFQALAPRRRASKPRPFTFLHVSSGFPRKGVDALLTAYATAFRSSDDVRLIIKVFPNPHNTVPEQIAKLRAEDRDAPAITLIDRDIGDAELLDLYRDADSLVLPTRGEGFNIPAAESMAAGLPLIVTGYGGHLDFCGDTARRVDYSFAASGSHLAVGGSLWVEPDVTDLTRALREVVSQRAVVPRQAFSIDAAAFANNVISAAAELLVLPPRPPLRIGWVSSWGVRCGIAEYSRHLLDGILAMGKGDEVTVLCDLRTDTTATELLNIDIQPSWNLFAVEDITPLIRSVGTVDPDVLVIQHQPGLIGWGLLTELLGAASVSGRPVVLVLHSTQRLLDIAEEDRDATLAAIAGVARVVVHTIHDMNRLKALGLLSNVTMIPQGAIALAGPRVTSDLPAASRPVVIGCYGFFLRDKGILQLVEAIALLRTRYGQVRLRLINAQHDSEESKVEIARCRAASEAAGFGHEIEWHTEFLPDADSRQLLQGCDIIALPYQISKEGSSAALRMAMSAGVPIAVTPLPLFDEAGAAVFRFRSTESVDIADGLGVLLDQPDQREALLSEMRLWMADRHWPLIACRFRGMLHGLRAERDKQDAHTSLDRPGASPPVLVPAETMA